MFQERQAEKEGEAGDGGKSMSQGKKEEGRKAIVKKCRIHRVQVHPLALGGPGSPIFIILRYLLPICGSPWGGPGAPLFSLSWPAVAVDNSCDDGRDDY